MGLKILRKMFPVHLSRALEIVNKATSRREKENHWFNRPIALLIDVVGDVAINHVTPQDIRAWYEHIKTLPHERKPEKKLSPWTVDSYGRAMKAFWGHLVDLGHIDESPAARLRLPKLPPKGKKRISQKDIDIMLRKSRGNPRDHAMILVLRDSGVRVGGLVSMRVSIMQIEGDDELRGKFYVVEKGNKGRVAFFGDAGARAVRLYLELRDSERDELWLNQRGEPLSESGVYQAMKRIARRAGVERFNPHAFRHAFVKRMVEQNVPAPVIQRLVGHEDFRTTVTMYLDFDDDDLEKHFREISRS